MQIRDFSFGSIRIDGTTHENDVVIEGGEIHKRKKKPSKKFRDDFGHTPLSMEEDIPWKCRRLVIGTGAYGNLPVMKEVKNEAERRKVELVIVPTAAATERRCDPATRPRLHSPLAFGARDELVAFPATVARTAGVAGAGVFFGASGSSGKAIRSPR